MISIAELTQIIGITIGAMFALLTLLVSVFIWAINRQDKTNGRWHSETRESADDLRKDTSEEFHKVRRETKEEFDNARRETKEEFDNARRETKEEFDKVRNEIAQVRAETKDEFDKVRNEIAEVRTEMAQMFQRYNEENERRHQELLRTIGLLYRHTHDENGRVIIPMDGANIVAPPAAPSPTAD